MAQKTILDLDLLEIAKQRMHASFAALITFVVFVAWVIFAGSSSSLMLIAGVQILLFALSIWCIVAGVMLQIAMGARVTNVIAFAIVTLIFSFLALAAAISQSSTILKLADAKIGFFGLSSTERAKITPGHCRRCGYDRAGLELLQECPECQRVPQVI